MTKLATTFLFLLCSSLLLPILEARKAGSSPAEDYGFPRTSRTRSSGSGPPGGPEPTGGLRRAQRGRAWSGVRRGWTVCRARGRCHKRKLTCPYKCYRKWSRAGKNYGAGGGEGGCTMDCKKCVAYC